MTDQGADPMARSARGPRWPGASADRPSTRRTGAPRRPARSFRAPRVAPPGLGGRNGRLVAGAPGAGGVQCRVEPRTAIPLRRQLEVGVGVDLAGRPGESGADLLAVEVQAVG